METSSSNNSSDMEVDNYITVTSESDNHDLDDSIGESIGVDESGDDMKSNQSHDSFCQLWMLNFTSCG